MTLGSKVFKLGKPMKVRKKSIIKTNFLWLSIILLI